MNHFAHDGRLFQVIAGVLGQTVEQVARLDASQADTSEQSWDSLQHINIILGVEAEFGIRFSLLEAVDLKTIPLIRAKLATLLH
ncbi:MAG: acyl carrier protein [Magnetococcales bacterium]|nr:acyl carrier protein [Magnetococcales bacterium]